MIRVLLDSASSTGSETSSILPLIGIYVVFFVVIYFIAIRPSRKRQKEAEAMQNNITNGDWVLLNNGMYGKVVGEINGNLLVEFGTNRSIIIPVRRDQITAKQEPDLTEKTYEEVEKAPEDPVVVEEKNNNEDQLDAYDQYILAKGGKKKGLFGKKKD